MKLAPTGVGAEPKKLALLGVLVVAGGTIWWFQTHSDSPTVSASVTPPPVSAPVNPTIKPLAAKEASAPEPGDAVTHAPRRVGGGSALEDFRPTMKMKDDLDVSKIDPRIRLDLLAKVKAMPMEGGSSSLFEFSKAPEPPAPKVEIKPGPVAVPVPLPVPAPPKPTPKDAGPPPPAPIPFKYYGYAGESSDGQLQGYFREGDAATGDIFIVREGETIQKRYRIVRVGIKSATVEDTTNHNEQQLPLLEEAQ